MNSKPNTPATADLAAALQLALTDPAAFAEQFPELAHLAPAPKPAKPMTARDYARQVDLAIIGYAGNLVAGMVPAEHRTEVNRLISNQLHHLSTPALGWPSETLPKPDRSDWR